MADSAQYVVTGHCVSVDTFTDAGYQRVMFYRGQTLPADVRAEQIRHNLDVGLIAEVPGSADTGVDSAGAAVADGERAGDFQGEPGERFDAANSTTTEQGVQNTPEDNTRQQAVDSTEAKRAAARAKLPTDGSAPDGRASQAVWVEYHVTQGGNYDDLVKQDKAELIKLAQQRQQ
jgi:hypothetical protein